MKKPKIYLKAIFSISVLSSTCVCAYEIETHDKLTLRAMESSKLVSDPSLLKDFGINDLSYTFPNTFGTSMTLKSLMSNGAKLEDGCDEATKGTSDEGKCETYLTEPNSMNGFNHFFDPQNNKGLTFPLPLCGNAVSSIDWATERNGQIGARKDCGLLDIVEQKYSYNDALDYYRKMLSASSSYERSRNTGLLFQSLGHVLHNLQDMAQPEHVRDDMHCPVKRCSIADLYTYGLLDLYDPSSYEKFTKEPSIFTSCVLPKLNSVNYPNVVAFDNPALFWDSGDGKGMAEFTSEHFVSPDTNFMGTILNPDPDVSHDLPDPPSLPSTSWRTEEVSIIDLAVNTCDQDLRSRYERLTGKVKFINQDIVDPYFPGVTYNNIRTSTWSVFTDDLSRKAPYFQTRYSLNQFNYESYYDVLIPRAVAFSEGLLDFFFRGRLGVSVGSSGNSITITNTSNQG